MYRGLLAAALGIRSALPAFSQSQPIPVKVVVVAMFERGADTGDQPGELQYWVERNHLDRVIPFPQGYHDLRMNRDGVLAVLTGVGTAKSAAAIMALGMDPRFDLTKAYWLVAGIAGINPARGSLGRRLGPSGWSMAISRAKSTPAKFQRIGKPATCRCAAPFPTSSLVIPAKAKSTIWTPAWWTGPSN